LVELRLCELHHEFLVLLPPLLQLKLALLELGHNGLLLLLQLLFFNRQIGDHLLEVTQIEAQVVSSHVEVLNLAAHFSNLLIQLIFSQVLLLQLLFLFLLILV